MDDGRKTNAEWRALGMLCNAVCADGCVCRGWRKYGVLCGLHYSIAEKDISKLTLVAR